MVTLFSGLLGYTMAAMTASVLNNFADLALSLPTPSLEATIKQNPTVVDLTGRQWQGNANDHSHDISWMLLLMWSFFDWSV